MSANERVRGIPVGDLALKSYAEVGLVMGITAARVYQIEQRALKKLRKRFAKMGIRSPFG